jgi:hypothetical protein
MTGRSRLSAFGQAKGKSIQESRAPAHDAARWQKTLGWRLLDFMTIGCWRSSPTSRGSSSASRSKSPGLTLSELANVIRHGSQLYRGKSHGCEKLGYAETDGAADEFLVPTAEQGNTCPRRSLSPARIAATLARKSPIPPAALKPTSASVARTSSEYSFNTDKSTP